jgi:hypothetical protein
LDGAVAGLESASSYVLVAYGRVVRLGMDGLFV